MPPPVRSIIESSEFRALGIGPRRARIHVRRWMPQASKGRVICFHGLGSNASEYRLFAEILGGLGYEVVAPDWIGHGDSEYLLDLQDYFWDRFVKMAWSVSVAYGGGPAHYVGNSWGAAVLYLALLGSPFQARSATFIDIPMKNNAAMARHKEYIADAAASSFDSFEEAEKFLYSRRPTLAAFPEAMRSYYRSARFRAHGGKVRFAFDPLLAGMGTAQDLASFDLRPHMPRLTAKALFIYGNESPHRNPELFRIICGRRTNVSYIDDISGGHPPSLLEREQIAPIAAFIQAAETVPAVAVP